jgi:hypothetical protein
VSFHRDAAVWRGHGSGRLARLFAKGWLGRVGLAEDVEMVVGGLGSHARTPPMDARTTSGSSANWIF